MEIIVSVPIDFTNSELRKIELTDDQILAIGDKYFELCEKRESNPNKHRDTKDFKCKDCKYLKRIVVKGKVRFVCICKTRTRNYHTKNNRYDFKYESQTACKSGFELMENSNSK